MATAIIVILGLFVGGGVAAQSSLPGDLLYSVKLNVNEKVQEAMAVSTAAKARVETSQAEERLDEAEKLSVRESVSTETRATIEANFKAFADRAEARLKELIEVDATAAADIASNFETALQAHQRVLARMETTDAESAREVHGLEVKTDTEAKDAENIRVKAEAAVRAMDSAPDVRTAAAGKIGAATNVLAEATAFIDRNKEDVNADTAAKADAQLAVASRDLAQANAKFQAGVYAEAFVLANAAIREAQEAKLVLEAHEEFELDVPMGRPSVTPTPRASVGADVNIHIQ